MYWRESRHPRDTDGKFTVKATSRASAVVRQAIGTQAVVGKLIMVGDVEDHDAFGWGSGAPPSVRDMRIGPQAELPPAVARAAGSRADNVWQIPGPAGIERYMRHFFGRHADGRRKMAFAAMPHMPGASYADVAKSDNVKVYDNAYTAARYLPPGKAGVVVAFKVKRGGAMSTLGRTGPMYRQGNYVYAEMR